MLKSNQPMTPICTGNPNQVWCYDEPTPEGNNRHIEMTEDEIVDKYYQFWAGEMVRVGKSYLVTPPNCIDEWIINNWAYKKEDKNE